MTTVEHTSAAFALAPVGRPALAVALRLAALLVPAVAAIAQTTDGFDPRPEGEVYALAVQPDGKVLAGGGFTTLGGINRNALGRLAPDGDVDHAFDAALTTSQPQGLNVSCLALQPDGRLFVGGDFQSINGKWRPALGSLLPNGALSPASWLHSYEGNRVRAMAMEADGKLLVAGDDSSARLVRYRVNPDEFPDSAFKPTADDEILCVAVQADGRILVGGRFKTLNGQPRNYLGRLRADGNLDDTFNPNADGEVRTLVVQPDGRILVGGDFTSIGGQSHARLARIEPGGAVETGFNVGLGANGSVRTIALQADGKMIVGGVFDEFGGQSREGLVQLLSDGSVDAGFDPSGTIATVHALALQPDGKLLVGGLVFQLMGLSSGNLGRLEGLGEATQSLTVDGGSITWQRGGASPEVWRTTFESSTDGLNWTLLEAGTRIAGGWQLTGLSLPANANVRARGWVTGGQGNGSTWFVEAVAGPPLALPVIVSQPVSQSRCPGPGQTVTFSVTATGNGPFTYRWRKDGADLGDSSDFQGAETDTLQVLRLNADLAGDYDVVVRNASGSVTSAVARLTIGGGPTFVIQPVDTTKNPGESATFEVLATGSQPMTYQWRRDGAPLAGRTGASLTVADLQCSERGVFDVIVVNACGTATSTAAALTVRGAPRILAQPANATGKADGSATFAVVADGATPLTYQWRKDGAPLAGQNQASSTLANVQLADRGWYDVVVANACGSVTSAPAFLTVVAANWPGPTVLGQWPGFERGPTAAVAVSGDLAYLAAAWGGLAVFNIRDLRNPVRIGWYPHSDLILDVQVLGDLAYVADGRAGLQVLDVSNPANPVRLGGYDTGGEAKRVRLVGNLAYVADGRAGLQVLDVSNPANPVRVGGYDTGGSTHDVQVVGHLAYLADYEAGLQVLDVSNPANPVRVGGLETSGRTAHTVQVLGNLAYIADGDAGLQVIDVSNPTNPARVSRFRTSGAAADVQVVGSLAYVADVDAGLQVIDVSNPASPARVGGYEVSGEAYGVLVIGGAFAFVAGDAGVLVLNLKTLGDPVPWGRIPTGGDASGVQVVGNLAYVADGPAGIQVLDVGNPASPVSVGGYDTRGNAHDVQVVGNLAYVADGNAGLQVLDVSDPASPVRVGGLDTSSSAIAYAYGVDVIGSVAFVADSWAGLQVIDVSNPANPVRLGGYDTSGRALGVHVVENLAYVADDDAGLQVIDVSNPANPVRLGGYGTSGSARGVHVVENLAYVADDDAGLQVIDVSHPANPVRVGGVGTSGYAIGLYVVGHLAYVAGHDAGLQVIDVSNPADPVRVGGFKTTGRAYGLQVAGNLAYVAQETWGLTVLQLFDDRPVIKEQPASQTRNLGESVTFTVTTVGTPPTSYQWRKDGVPISGQTGATLTLSGIEKADAGLYDVIAANDYGSTASQQAELKLNLILDESFRPRLYQSVLALAPQSGGRVLLAGYPGMLGIGDRRYLARLDREGTAEPAYGPNVEGPLVCMAPQLDGGLWVGGSARLPGESANLLVRFDGQGSVSAGLELTPGTTGQAEVRSLAWQADGKLLVGGVFGTLGGKSRLSLARLNVDGAVDDGFSPAVDGSVEALAVQPDGKILVGGGFWRLAGQSCRSLGRLFPDSRFDNSFANITDGGYVRCLIVQPDGSILVGGIFTSWNGVPRTNLCRVNTAGQLDPDFDPVVTGHRPGEWEGVTSLALQADGKILLAGLFTTVGGLPRTYLARLHPDGTPDVSFAPNPTDSVWALALEADGGLLAGGTFSSIAGGWQPHAARLLNHDPTISVLEFTPSAITWRRGGSTPEVWRTTFETSADGVNWTPLGAGMRIADGWQLTGLSLEGQSRIRARGFVGSGGGSDYFVESFAGAPTIPDDPRLMFPGPGEPLTLTARFEGTGPFSFQWFKASHPLTDGGNFDGATSANLTIRNPTLADAGEYSIEVSNAQGTLTVPVATVAFGPPKILRQPTGLSVLTDQPATFSVAVEGTPPITYRWRKNGAHIVGATEPHLSIASAVLQDAGHYDVVVENSYGTVVSAPAELTVRFPAIGALAFSQAELEAGENSGTVNLSVTRAGGGDGAVSVDYRLAVGGTATEGQDFTFAAGTLSWADGETGTKSIDVAVLDDSAEEPPETIHIELANPTGGATLGMPAVITVTVNDDDAPVTYALTLTPSPADAGTIQTTPTPNGDGKYAHGTVVTLRATPAPGAVFLGWEGALTGQEPVDTITVTQDLAVRAVFRRPFGGVARRVPGLIQAEDFDEGGEGIGYHDADAVNQGGSTYRTGGVDVLLGAQGLRVGWSDNGEWLNYTVNVPAAGLYRAVLRVSSGESGGTGRLRLPDGQTTALIAAPGTGAWSSYVEVTSAPFTLDAGTQVVQFEFVQAGFDLDWIRLEGGELTLRGAANLAGSGEVGVRFNHALDPTSATRAANYAIPGVTVPSGTLSPDATGVLLRVTGTLDPVFTVRVNGVRDTVGNQVADGAEAVGQVLAQRRQDVGTAGDPAAPGVTFSSRAGDFDVLAGGTDMWNNQDGFHFVHERLTGDFDVRVRVESLEAVNRWSKAGLMARESLAADSRNLAVVVEPPAVPTRDGQFGGVGENIYAPQWRAVRGGATTFGGLEGVDLWQPPYPNAWVRLQRQGSLFRAYRGNNGQQWTLIGETTLSLPQTLYVGLGTSSHNNAPGFTALARYREYQRVGLLAPHITTEPVDLTVASGGSAQFAVAAFGSEPLQHQWQFEGRNLAGAASPILSLNNVTPDAAGTYRAVVWNDSGLQVSRSARLTVTQAVRPLLTLTRQGVAFELLIEGLGGESAQVLYSTDLEHWEVLTEVSSVTGAVRVPLSPPDQLSGFLRVRVGQ